MTEPYTPVLAYETAAELPAGRSDIPLVVTVNPPAVYIRSGGVWVPVASVEGNIPTPTVVNASETAAGIAELATQGETDAGADASRIVTPARLAGRTATEARSGVVELATTAETQAGADGTRAVHPAGLKSALAPETPITPTLVNGWVAYDAPYLAPGYYKDATGRVHLQGTVKNGTGGTTIFTLPVGYRPPATVAFTVDGAGGTAAGTSKCEVSAEGAVFAIAVSGNTRYSLNGIYFGAA